MNETKPTPAQVLDQRERVTALGRIVKCTGADHVERLTAEGYTIVETEWVEWMGRLEEAAKQMPIDLDDWLADV